MFEFEIQAHAEADRPREACGLIARNHKGKLTAVPLPNTSPEPERFFRLDPETVHRMRETGNVVGYYHSHAGSHEPSQYDRDVADHIQLPAFIYGLEDKILGVYKPAGWRLPLEGRPFCPMVADCIALIDDYMREICGVQLPDIPRTQRDYYRGPSFDLRAMVEAAGVKVAAKPEPHDIIAMNLYGAKRINHLAIYIGDGLILHQAGTDNASAVEVYEGYWEHFTCMIFRHPDAHGKPRWNR